MAARRKRGVRRTARRTARRTGRRGGLGGLGELKRSKSKVRRAFAKGGSGSPSRTVPVKVHVRRAADGSYVGYACVTGSVNRISAIGKTKRSVGSRCGITVSGTTPTRATQKALAALSRSMK